MQLKSHFLVAIAAALVTPALLSGCGGPECGPGTTEQDGECRPAANQVTCAAGTTLTDGECVSDTEQVTCATGTTLTDGECVSDTTVVTCAAGTTLTNGECVLSAAGCGANTMLVDGACVGADPDLSQACGAGTTYDMAAQECVADSSISCGANTVEMNGECVPDSTALCSTGTVANADGVCVVGAAVCGANTVLDPNSNTCVIGDGSSLCGANTAFDADSGTCVPADTVCDVGTFFNMDTGLCLPEATCAPGDEILAGVCVSPAEKAFAEADLAIDEIADRAANNDDPDFGGTATALTLPAIGTSYSVSGQINTSVDLDNDGTLDQDADSYTFTGTAGQAFSISVQPVAGPSLGFRVESADGSYTRLSTLGLGSGAARQVVLPEDGTYTVTVLPVGSLTNTATLSGDDSWNYVLTLEEIAGPMAVDVDASTGPITGDFANLTDNLYRVTNLTMGEIVTFSFDDVGDDVIEAEVQIWSSPTQYVGSFDPFTSPTVALPAGDVYLFFDWVRISGNDTSFSASVTPLGNQENLGAIAPNGGTATTASLSLANDEFRYFSFSATPGEIIEITQSNDGNSSADIVITDSNGDVVFDDSSINSSGSSTSPEAAYFYAADGGNYTVTVQANSSQTNSALVVTSITPASLGSFGIGDTISLTDATTIDEGRAAFALITLTDDVSATGSLLGGAGETTADLRIIDAVTGEILLTVTSDTDDLDLTLLPAGNHIVQITAAGDPLPTGFALNLSLTPAPLQEMEPNDSLATAQVIPVPGSVLGTGGYGAGGVTGEWALPGGAVGTPFDYYQFTLAQDLLPGETLSVTLSATATVQASSFPDFLLYNSAGVQLGAKGDINNTLEFSSLAAGTYYIGILVPSSTTFDTAYKLSLATNTFPVTAIGTVAADSTGSSAPSNQVSGDRRVITFTATAGQLIELSQDNDDDSSLDITVSDPNGNTVWSDSSFGDSSGTSSEYAAFYTTTGGVYSILVENNGTANNGTLSVDSTSPSSLTPIALTQGTPLDENDALALDEGRSRAWLLSAATDVSLSGEVTSPVTGEETAVTLINTATGEVLLDEFEGNISFVNVPAGDYVLIVKGETDLTLGYDVDFNVNAPPTTLDGTTGDTCAVATPVNMNGAYIIDTSLYTNTYTPSGAVTSCTNFSANGADAVFSVTLNAGQTLTATLRGTADTSLYLISDCADANGSCLAGDDNGGTSNPEVITYTNATAMTETYFLVADLFSATATSNSTLTVDIQ